MAFVVTDNCIRCKYTDCVAVCPAEAFYEGPNFLVISPDDCIDCDLCPIECPAGAIYQEDEVPEDQKEFIQLNADLAKFKVASLRNVALTYPYMYNGSIETLDEVIEHYASGGKKHPNQSDLIKGFEISKEEKKALLAFIFLMLIKSALMTIHAMTQFFKTAMSKAFSLMILII